MKLLSVQPKFVRFIPDVLDPGAIYVSDEHRIAMHRCCCGCGSEVVTPLSPADWQLTRSGDVITLSPSIGNWAFPCQSHYFIRRNRVVWAPRMSAEEIDAVRQRDQRDKAGHIERVNARKTGNHMERAIETRATTLWSRIWKTVKKWIGH